MGAGRRALEGRNGRNQFGVTAADLPWSDPKPEEEATRKSQPLLSAHFDPSFMLMSMRLWRDVIDFKTPVHDNFKVHFIENRGSILKGYVATASAWQMMLRGMKPDDTSAKGLAEVSQQVAEFAAWAESELKKLEGMQLQASLEQGINELLQDPDIAATFQRMASGFITKKKKE